MNALGHHILCEFYDCDPLSLGKSDIVEQVMLDAATLSGATIVNHCFHQFSPYGVSGVVVISESHLAIHTWPEYGYAAVDLFTCGDSIDGWAAFECLKKGFGSQRVEQKEFFRGYLPQVALPLVPG